jgi:hypothetical protein
VQLFFAKDTQNIFVFNIFWGQKIVRLTVPMAGGLADCRQKSFMSWPE